MITLIIPPVAVGRQTRRVPHNMQNQRMHWAARNRWNVAWREAVGWEWTRNKEKPSPLPLKFAKIQVVLSVMKLFDKDGSYSAVKPILDGLTAVGAIIDDSPQYIDLEVVQNKSYHRKDEGVKIYINY